MLCLVGRARGVSALRTSADDGPHLVDVLRACVEGDAFWKRRADREIPFLELRHEFAAEQREERRARRDDDETEGEARASDAGAQCVCQGRIHAVQRAHHERFLFLEPCRDELPGEDGEEREGQEDRRADREGVGARHRREDDPRDAGHREERDEGAADDECRESHRRPDLRGSSENALPHRPSSMRSEMTEDVLHHDDRGVDDDAEVDRADGDQVCRGLREDDAGEGAPRIGSSCGPTKILSNSAILK